MTARPTGLTPAVLTSIYGEEDWSATIRKVDETRMKPSDGQCHSVRSRRIPTAIAWRG